MRSIVTKNSRRQNDLFDKTLEVSMNYLGKWQEHIHMEFQHRYRSLIAQKEEMGGWELGPR